MANTNEAKLTQITKTLHTTFKNKVFQNYESKNVEIIFLSLAFIELHNKKLPH